MQEVIIYVWLESESEYIKKLMKPMPDSGAKQYFRHVDGQLNIKKLQTQF
jgi:hypothetical protein